MSSPAATALAAWSTFSGPGASASQSRTLPTGPTPSSISASSGTVTVHFPQVAVGTAAVGSLDGGSYQVRRYDGAGVAQAMPGGACTVSGPAASLTCSDSTVPAGDWHYGVTPVLHAWRGPEGPRVAVTVAGPVLGNLSVRSPGNPGKHEFRGSTTHGTAQTANDALTPGAQYTVKAIHTSGGVSSVPAQLTFTA